MNAGPNQAALYRAALLLGLVRGDVVVRWADSVIERDGHVPNAFIELSTIDPADVTALRHALLQLCDEKPNDMVACGLLDLIDADLESGRRAFATFVRNDGVWMPSGATR